MFWRIARVIAEEDGRYGASEAAVGLELSSTVSSQVAEGERNAVCRPSAAFLT